MYAMNVRFYKQNEFCKLMNSAISSKEFLVVNDCLQDKDMCFNLNPEDSSKEKIINIFRTSYDSDFKLLDLYNVRYLHLLINLSTGLHFLQILFVLYFDFLHFLLLK